MIRCDISCLHQGSFQLKITIDDIDSGEDDLVDEVVVQISSLTVAETFTTTSTYTGTNGEGSIDLQFRVMCADTYYGPDCTTKCVPVDGTDGHYTCNSDGSKACLSGWSGISTNCLTRK